MYHITIEGQGPIHIHLPDTLTSSRIMDSQAVIIHNQGKIMSAISEFVAKQNAFNDRQEAALLDIQGDFKFLKDKISDIQNSPGQLSDEDQASLDVLNERVELMTNKFEALAAATPPGVPAGPGEPGDGTDAGA